MCAVLGLGQRGARMLIIAMQSVTKRRSFKTKEIICFNGWPTLRMHLSRLCAQGILILVCWHLFQYSSGESGGDTMHKVETATAEEIIENRLDTHTECEDAFRKGTNHAQ